MHLDPKRLDRPVLVADQALWKALGMPLAQATAASTTGFALVDVAGHVAHSNPAFNTLLGFRGGAEGVTLPVHLATVYRIAPETAASAFESEHPASLELRQGRDDGIVDLSLAGLVDGQRIVTAFGRGGGDAGSGASNASRAPSPIDEARTDPLTRLGNRNLLSAELDAWREADSESLAIIMLDLDRFKPINDTLGHAAGDKLLMLVADRLKRAARRSDTVVRLGGDEFVVLHPCAAVGESAEKLATRLVDLIGRPFLLDGQQVNIGASAGISRLGEGTASREDLLRHADLALYDAKAHGRKCWRRFDPSLESRANDRRELELALRRALLLREFVLVYQPQVELSGGDLTGFEALIRWDRPEIGIVSPLDFIPLAEETGEIHAIGEWVMREACCQAMEWPTQLRVAVNVSPVQFANEHFVDTVSQALAVSGLPPERLEVEITEGVLIDDQARALRHLNALRDMGVSIAMDDFGTGYSSLGYLSSFPFSKIKIDQSFVRGEQSERSRSLVRSILSLGESLGMTTLAEGVETDEQYAELVLGGCSSAQGYLISRPIDAASVVAFMDRHKANRSVPETSADEPEKREKRT